MNMRIHSIRYSVKKLLGLILSATLITVSFTAAFAASEESAGKLISSVSPVLLTCETGNLVLANNGRSTELHLCLTQAEERIRQRIYREDVILGGVFRDMIVSGVRNDRKTILLDLIGVPDLSGEKADVPQQGTMEFPGALFGCEDKVEACASITGRDEKPEDMKPSFSTYLESMREDGDSFEICIQLLPTLGEFAKDFSKEDICFARGLKDADIRSFSDAGNGCYELIFRLPKEGMKSEGEGLSCFGSIILSENSMVSPGKKTYEKKLYSAGKYSMEMAGRGFGQDDVNSLKMDARSIKEFVALFGDTSFGTIATTTYGGLSAMSAGYTILSLVGILPTSSGNASLMKELQSIHRTLDQVNEKCDYMSGVLDVHTKMLSDLGVKLDEQYLGGFNADFGSMIDAMDLLQEEINTPWVKRQIEEAVRTVAEKYEAEQNGAGRDFDEDDDIIVPDPEYYDYGHDAAEGGYANAAADDGMLEVMMSDPGDYESIFDQSGDDSAAELNEDANAATQIPDAIPAEDGLDEPAEEAGEETEEETPSAIAAAMQEETLQEDALPADDEDTAEETLPSSEAETAEEVLPSSEAETAEEALPSSEADTAEEALPSSEEETAEEALPSSEAEATAETLLAPDVITTAETLPAAGQLSSVSASPLPSEESESLPAASEDVIADEAQASESEEPIVEYTENTFPESRILDSYETQMYLMDLNYEIGKIHLTANITIGDILRKIAADYSTLAKRFDTSDSSNPIVAFCSAHEGTDNFATTSQGEKEMYKQNVKYQLFRALTILSAMDSPTAYKRSITSLQNKDAQNTWPDVERNSRDRKGNPFCYLMEGYVRLATRSEIEDWWDPLKNPDSKNYKDKVQQTNRSGVNASIEEFLRRMHGRNLVQELELAEIKNLKSVREEGFGGMTFSYERWGVKNGYKKYERNYYAWTDSVRYADPDSVYDHVNWGGQLLDSDKSYIIVATPYIRWTDGPGDHPAESLLYQGDKKTQSIMYCMTTLVNP